MNATENGCKLILRKKTELQEETECSQGLSKKSAESKESSAAENHFRFPCIALSQPNWKTAKASQSTEHDSVFHADVTPETFRRTSLSELSVGSSVNLERAMKADGRFGGHIVSGHIDGTGRFVGAQNEENAVNVTISADKSLGRYIIEKGSVCIDGISLTVASVSYSENVVFTVAVIPHTWKNTTLSEKNSGSLVNIECDIVGKYIEHFVNFGSTSGNSENAGENSAEDSEALAEMMTNFTSFH